MENVVKRLKEYSCQVNLKKRFNYNFNIAETLFEPSEISELSNNDNPFEQNVRLKWILSKKYKTYPDLTTIDFWIINDWGGIRGFKPTDRNIQKIVTFKNQLVKRKLSLDSFSTISSLSKLSSFIDSV